MSKRVSRSTVIPSDERTSKFSTMATQSMPIMR